jgi:hypothetical protein
MISIQIIGGFGNQMFQVFAAFAYSIQYSTKMVFPYHCDMGHRKTYWGSFFKEIVPYTTENKENNCTENDIGSFRVYREPHYSYDSLPYFKDAPVLLCGYFQSYKYFENYREPIIELLKIPDKKREVLAKYPALFDSSGKTVSIHFRLGDYKTKRYYHPILNYEYFESALETIMTSGDVSRALYICEEEDNAYVESQIRALKSKYDIEYVKVDDSIPDYEQMLIMSCCHHNIISNSSFSWWGAYLNDSPSKIVCYPSVWFGEYFEHSHDLKDLLCDSWTKVEANPVHWSKPLV